MVRGILSTGQAEVALLCELDKRFRIFLQNQSFRDQTFRCLPDQLHVSAMRAVALLQRQARIARALYELRGFVRRLFPLFAAPLQIWQIHSRALRLASVFSPQ